MKTRKIVLEGFTFHVTSGSIDMGPGVIVPIDQCEHLSNEQIGAIVRGLFDSAREVAYELEAEYLLYQRNISEEDALDFLLHAARFEEDNPTIKRVCESLRETVQRIERRKHARQRSKEFRKEIATNYAEIFVKIGQRDGFKCKECDSVEELTIDHILALVNGGTNDLHNLQLLCKTCNCKKGTS